MDHNDGERKLFVIDSHALIYRAYHAVPTLTSQNRNVNAVYGFLSIFLKIINRYQPDYIVCAFDLSSSTLIKKGKFDWYKANREKSPDELIAQFEYIKDILNSFNIKILESIDYEADDIVASLVKKFRNEKLHIYVVTGDKDLIQLVEENVDIIMPGKSFSDPLDISSNNVKDFLGFDKKYLLTYKSLKGDPSDNIPGVPGIGDKIAKDLILEFGDLDDIYKNISKIKKTVAEKLLNNKDIAYESNNAASLFYDIKFDFQLDELTINFDVEKIVGKLKEYEFNSFIKKYFDLKEETISKDKKINNVVSNNQLKNLYDAGVYNEFSENAKNTKKVFFDILVEGDSIFYIVLSFDLKKYFYLKNINGNISKLKEIFEDNSIEKVGFDLKQTMKLLYMNDIEVNGMYFDINLAYFLLSNKNLHLKNIIYELFNEEVDDYSDLTFNGKYLISDIEENKVIKSIANNVHYIYQLYNLFIQDLNKDQKINDVMFKIDLPLIKILFNIEREGILLDTHYLKDLYDNIKDELSDLEKKIYQIAGEEFNISSSKQLSNILYQKLKLPFFKKLKSGIFATDELTLSILSNDYEIIDFIRKYKELKKIETTYTLNLIKLVDSNNKLHTTYNLTGVSTGRLSSKNPNLQNIPNKTNLGRDIRRAFVAEKDNVLVSLDYSQIELRLMAHFSKDKNMIDAFRDNLDIHKYTASKIFNKGEDMISDSERNRAKTINFGIIYGLSSFGLSRQLGISRSDADSFIKSYFDTFPGIRDYYKYIEDFVAKNGFVETLYGRKRYFNINSGSYIAKSQMIREAINMPIQGTSADIIKIAMIKINDNLLEKFNSTIRLQIHDELVFSLSKKSNLEKFIKDVSLVMSDFPEISVPLKVDSKYGTNLRDLKRGGV